MVELAALEKRYGATHRGFESLSPPSISTLRKQGVFVLLMLSMSMFN